MRQHLAGRLLQSSCHHWHRCGQSTAAAQPLALLRLGVRTASSFVKDGQAATDKLEVIFVDPKLVLERDVAEVLSAGVRIEMSVLMASMLHQGDHELGDMDDPLNAWVFGKRAELFQYQMAGMHSTKSGFTSALSLGQLREFQALPVEQRPGWQAFLDAVAQEHPTWPQPGLPFIFAGRILESSRCSVYRLTEAGGQVTGVMVSSAGAEEDAEEG